MLTTEQRATNFDTCLHIQAVQRILFRMAREILHRAEVHDQSKLGSPEVEAFTEHTTALAKSTYGSPEYKERCEAMRPALEHHYGHNRHHPEHFKEGVNEMNLVDLIEMLCDWKAASMRHNDGNIRRSIEINADRFGLSPQLVRIFENTVELLDV